MAKYELTSPNKISQGDYVIIRRALFPDPMRVVSISPVEEEDSYSDVMTIMLHNGDSVVIPEDFDIWKFTP